MNVSRLMLGLALLGLASACEEPAAGPINPSFTQAVVHESFSGQLPLLSSRFYSFTMPRSGRVALTLLSLTAGGAPSSEQIGLGIGVPRGFDCIVSNTAVSGPGATPQLQLELDPGVFCAAVFDNSTLTQPVDFSLNITRPQ
jgi:hypothetical protein